MDKIGEGQKSLCPCLISRIKRKMTYYGYYEKGYKIFGEEFISARIKKEMEFDLFIPFLWLPISVNDCSFI